MDVLKEELWIEHLRCDIMPFWQNHNCLGNPIGNFPAFINQDGNPLSDRNHYMRMHGRRIYGFLAAYDLLGNKEYLEYARRGFEWLEKHAVNPAGGYWSQLTPDGKPVVAADITIQDLSYTVFPYIKYYKLSQDTGYLKPVIDVIRFVLNGPYCRNGILVDSMNCNYSEVRYFEGESLNLVSLMDLMNLLLVPLTGNDENIRKLLPELPDVMENLLDLLISEFYRNGIFWNDRYNRTDYSAKHVDLGHTSKAYGILFKTNRYLAGLGKNTKYHDLEKAYIPIVLAASDPKIGWLTDFQDSAISFRTDSIQWWRYIMIDQVAAVYAEKYPEVIPALINGLQKWFELPFVDRKRDVRGIRESLRADGSVWTDEADAACKANMWKSAYHEVEHVEVMLSYIKNHNAK